MKAILAHLTQRQRGQTLIIFTLLFTVLIGFLALALDLGFLFGQRRWNQDGSDAAAVAAGKLVAESVAPLSINGIDGIYISIADQQLYDSVRTYGGLDSNPSGQSSVPTGVNQNPGLDGSNKVAVILEYNTGKTGAQWCYSPASISALPPSTTLPRSVESNCTLDGDPSNNTQIYPPAPSTTTPYKVRVTVSSVTQSSFAQVLVPSGNMGPSVGSAGLNDLGCVRPGNASGMLSCAQAIVTIAGTTTAQSTAATVPITVSDCAIGANYDELYPLWSSQTASCPNQNVPSSWGSFVDLTVEYKWCSGGNFDYPWTSAYPDSSIDSQPYGVYAQSGGPCNNPLSPLTNLANDWYRRGYTQSTATLNGVQYVGDDVPKDDVQLWASKGYGGTIVSDAEAKVLYGANGHGNYLPTYCAANGSCAVQGQNIDEAFYCNSQGIAQGPLGVYGCQINGLNSDTYFFRNDMITSDCPLPGNVATPSNFRCRMAGVPTWDNPQDYFANRGRWDTPNGNSANNFGRVQVMRIVSMRLYCQMVGNYCTGVPNFPSGVTINVKNNGVGASTVIGLFVSASDPNCTTCTSGLSFITNKPYLSQ